MTADNLHLRTLLKALESDVDRNMTVTQIREIAGPGLDLHCALHEAKDEIDRLLARERYEALPIGHMRFGGRRIAQDPNYADLDRRSGVVTRGQQ